MSLLLLKVKLQIAASKKKKCCMLCVYKGKKCKYAINKIVSFKNYTYSENFYNFKANPLSLH